MKKISLIYILVCLSCTIYSQREHCDSLIIRGHYVPFDTQKIAYTSDYIKEKWNGFSGFISNRNNLEEIPTWINFKNKVIMVNKSETVIVKIDIDYKKIDAGKYFYSKEGNDLYSNILDNPKQSPYGITSEDTIVSYLSNIKINDIQVPEMAIKDLLNPNISETFLSIKPIQIYNSKCGRYLYLYVFGKLQNAIIADNIAFNFSYMAKLIFKADGNYIGRIVERGEYLNYFGFNQCPYFVGF